MKPIKCEECGVSLSAEDVELCDGFCDSCRSACLYQEVYDENYEDWSEVDEDDED